MKSTDKNDVARPYRAVFWIAAAIFSIYRLTQEFSAPALSATTDTVVANEFEGYPRTPDSIEACPLHAEYVYRIMLLRAEGKTKEEILNQEAARWERFKSQQPNATPAYWAWTEYAVAEAYRASEHVMGSNERMLHYALRYFNECVRMKKEEAEE